MSPKTEKKLSTVDSSVRMHMTLMKSGYVDRVRSVLQRESSNTPSKAL